MRRPIFKNISERLHCWKVFCENVFQIRSEINKRNCWQLAVWKVAQISQDWIKDDLLKKKKIKFLYKSTTTAIGKSFVKNQIKTENIFLHNSIKISGNFGIKHLQWSRFIQRNKKKCSKKRYFTNFSSSHLEV